ncbi:hypothetical protein Dimus_034962 [Dionaea muscipula]
MADSTGSGHKITAEDVISKIKDDGDFDKLRIKIIRKLKENEDLRSNIISVVKESTALNQVGAENMKPGQLFDAIHEEIRDKVMNQISDGLWEIIRSTDGMKTEITETVHSVYDKLINPQRKEEEVESASSLGTVPKKRASPHDGLAKGSSEIDGMITDGDLKEPPGFPVNNHTTAENHGTEMQHRSPSEQRVLEEKEEPPPPQSEPFETEDGDPSVPPGFSGNHKLSDGSDEDPDVPPGFG